MPSEIHLCLNQISHKTLTDFLRNTLNNTMFYQNKAPHLTMGQTL